MKRPALLADGSCSACVLGGGWQCKFHQEELAALDRERAAMFKRVAAHVRASRIESICARYELESDEFQTREQKALAFL